MKEKTFTVANVPPGNFDHHANLQTREVLSAICGHGEPGGPPLVVPVNPID